ncbi:MAG: GNA1162 family protein [Thermodesulfobacteriota bacterium]
MNRKRLAICILTLIFSMGCAAPHHLLVEDYKSRNLRSIAVLPVQNETPHLQAPEIFRPIVYQKIRQKGYESPALSFIDSKLAEKDIRDAGQIHSLTPQDLGKLLGVDALLYTTVTEFSTTYLIAYASITVGAKFELKDARTGQLVWQADHRVKDMKAGTEQSLKFAIQKSYTPYSQKVTETCLATLPNGPLASAPAQKGCLTPGGR